MGSIGNSVSPAAKRPSEVRRFLAIAAVLAVILPSIALAATSSGAVRAEIRQIEATTRQIRGLAAKSPVKVVLLGNSGFDKAWGVYLREDQSAAEIELDRRESVELGFLSSKASLRHILFHQSAAYILGFYDQVRKALYVRNNSNEVLGAGRHTIAHEYTHALQDEHYDLGKLLPDQFALAYRNSDAVGAHHALTEGDAVLTEQLYIRQTYNRQDLQALAREEAAPVPGPALPRALKRQLYFPYTTGVDFVARLYQLKGMAGVDAAYKRLPDATYQIMHPSAYLAGWQPVELSLHAVTGFSDWQQVDDDVFGAFGYDLLIWQFGRKRLADRVTTGYRGDRYLFLERGADDALLMKSLWTNSASARSAERALLASFKVRLPHAHVSTGSATVLHNPKLAIYLVARGSHLTVAMAPTTALVRQLGTAPTT